MKRSIFLLVTALASFMFGAMMFFIPNFAAGLLDIAKTPQTTSGEELLTLPLDVSDKTQVHWAVEKTIESFGRIDLL